MGVIPEAETRHKLLRNVKKEVKQIMEEAVTRKFVHADSSHIISFCAVVEACVLHGLKRRAAGLLCSNKVAALFMKVGKSFTPVEELCQKVQELEQLIETKQAQLNNVSVPKQPRVTNLPPQGLRNLWIRTALMEKLLDKIVMYLVENSSTFYDREAILMDAVDGPILASLLVGPCALEYTKVKTADHFWTDPSADELVQRHRIHSGHCRQDSPSRRPALIQKRQSSGSMEDRPILWARDYVESLHQNNRATLLFGKNNVLVQPRDDMEAIPGYLSLHQTADLMTLKWTPNQLMNGTVADDTEKSVYWDFAMTIRLAEIVYLHCHQQVDSGGTVVLVSQDGIQRPPLRFPRGGHLLQFLTCLETGLLPHGQLDPPLWSQRGKGKVFPKLRKRSPQGSVESVSDKEEDEATDYVFRILLPGTPSDFVAPELMDQALNMWHPTPRKSSCFSCALNGSRVGSLPNGCNQDRAPLKLLCDTMKYQIISRAFYGWLAYCRHLSTVRIHLSALVNPTIVDPDVPHDAQEGLTVDVWSSFLQDRSAYDEHELLRLVYYGGVAPTIRKEVWPFLLGHYHFDMTQKCRIEVDEQVRACYEQTMKEWLGCEDIVKQNEGQKHAEAIAKCNSVASVDRPGPVQRDSTISTDSSQSIGSDKQIAHSQSDSRSSTQAFWFVEEVELIESETKREKSKERSKTTLKDLRDVAIPNGTSDSGDRSFYSLSIDSGLPEQPQSTNNNNSPVSDSPVRPAATQPSPEPSAVQGAASSPVAKAEPPLIESPFTVLGTEVGSEELKLPITVDDKAASAGEFKAPEHSDDSPSALEMEDIPTAWARPLSGLMAPPPAPLALGRVGSGGPVLDAPSNTSPDGTEPALSEEEPEMESLYTQSDSVVETEELKPEVSPVAVSPAGTTYSQEQLDLYLLNLHRIDKDVRRCDRSYWYFTPANLEKLRNIMCSYVWQHLEIGYVQGMCDLLAPLLVILDDEVIAFSCFSELMKRMNHNFPHGGAMDSHFANMRSLIQILDAELFEVMQMNGDYTHFYFCYRWFLLDFKREMVYDDVFSVWETIWAATYTSSTHFVLFIALALVEMYRDIILENNMDFTDIIKFFNEMAEHHNVPQVLTMARDLVLKVQTLIENK
ncbi:small G protein signaling modulator 1-like [Salvelinus namaycush]|uniref:Small G protein signaling modulator 1-like n=1 Tax=Salvelinus namaycush TaxID=8040 RepID=A0A8U0QLR5_SALNM|nr:small G protein signaling modulator 1-like [Salvelinus namaycush]